MSKPFDPYHVWLGIPKSEQPANYYRLLGLAQYESRSDVISINAQGRMAQVKAFGIGKHAELSQKILNELAKAKVCLLNANRRARYDEMLRKHAAATLRKSDTASSSKSARKTRDSSSRSRGPAESARQRSAKPAAQSDADPPAGSGNTAPPPTSPPRAWVVGSASECDLVVAQPTVSARHCRLRAFGRGYVIEDLGSTNGTFVNQQRIDRPTRVHRGDSITLGKKVPMPWPEDARVVLRTIRIGAAPDNDVVLAYPYISGHHARLLVGERDLVIEDLGSTNGTAVGDRRNRVQRAAIAAGDVVYFGSHPVRVSKLLEAGRR